MKACLLVKKEVKIKYSQIKKSFKKNEEIINIKNSLFDVKKSISENIKSLEDIKSFANNIVKKSNYVNANELIDALPAQNLRELDGDFSKKITFKDIDDLTKMQKKSNILLENQANLERKQKILNIELLQKQIEILLNDKRF